MKKILMVSTLLGSFIPAIFGCSTVSQKRDYEFYRNNLREAAKKLNVRYIEDVSNLAENCITTRSGEMDLRTLAGLHVGSIKATKTPDGYRLSGSYSQLRNPDALIEACNGVDSNGDGLVTDSESHKAVLKAAERYSK